MTAEETVKIAKIKAKWQEEHFGVYYGEKIYQVKTCSREIAALMVVNNVQVIKY